MVNELAEKISERVRHIIATLENESTRGKILLLSAHIDSLLEGMIKRTLKPARNEKYDELLSGNAPLDSFSARISIAYRLGLISEHHADGLNAFRKLRNLCAHELTPLSLAAQPHNAFLKNFFSKMIDGDELWLHISRGACPKSEEQFLMTVGATYITHLELTATKIEPMSDTFWVFPNKESELPQTK